MKEMLFSINLELLIPYFPEKYLNGLIFSLLAILFDGSVESCTAAVNYRKFIIALKLSKFPIKLWKVFRIFHFLIISGGFSHIPNHYYQILKLLLAIK